MRARSFVTLIFMVSFLCFTFLFVAYGNISRTMDAKVSPIPATTPSTPSSPSPRDTSKIRAEDQDSKEDEDDDDGDAFDFDPRYGEWDSSRKFKHFPNVVIGSRFLELSRMNDVTLATQASLDRLHWLPVLTRTWTGPISVAVFVPDLEFQVSGR